MSSPFVDPVVAEVHAIRQAMLKAAGGDVGVLMQQVADRQSRSTHVIVRGNLAQQTSVHQSSRPR
jgi:hypothetical protein